MSSNEEQLSRARSARAYFMQGYNCAQSVSLAFADLTGLDRDSLAKLASSFGGGFGRLREICGAVSGMGIVAGLLYGYAAPETGAPKSEHYKRIQELAGRFEAKNGTIICRTLLGRDIAQSPTPEPRTPEYYGKRPCADLVACAAEILERYILENPPEAR